MAQYDNLKVLKEFMHDDSYMTHSSFIKLDDSHYMLAYSRQPESGDVLDGYISVFEIDDDYNITRTSILAHETSHHNVRYNSIIHLIGNIYVLTYMSVWNESDNEVYMKVFTMNASYVLIEEKIEKIGYVSGIDYSPIDGVALTKVQQHDYVVMVAYSCYTKIVLERFLGKVRTYKIDKIGTNYEINYLSGIDHSRWVFGEEYDKILSIYGSQLRNFGVVDGLEGTKYLLTFTTHYSEFIFKDDSYNFLVVRVSDDGNIFNTSFNTFESSPDIDQLSDTIVIDNDHFLSVHNGVGPVGMTIRCFEYNWDYDGSAGYTLLDSKTFAIGHSKLPAITRLNTNYFLLSYNYTSDFVRLKTFIIDSYNIIENTDSNDLIFDPFHLPGNLIVIDDEHYIEPLMLSGDGYIVVYGSDGGEFNFGKISVKGQWKDINSIKISVDGDWKSVPLVKIGVDGNWK